MIRTRALNPDEPGIAHDLADAIAAATRTRHDPWATGNGCQSGSERVSRYGRATSRRPDLDPERLEKQLESEGWARAESAVLALAVYATLASPVRKADADWIASASARIGDSDLLLDMAGVVFAFNTVNRVADARRVQLEYQFLRKLAPVKGWVERRFATLTGLAYDLSYTHKTRHDPDELLDRLSALFQRLGAPVAPLVFAGLRPAPQVLEGIFEMIDVNSRDSSVQPKLWMQAVAIATASHAMLDSNPCLRYTF